MQPATGDGGQIARTGLQLLPFQRASVSQHPFDAVELALQFRALLDRRLAAILAVNTRWVCFAAFEPMPAYQRLMHLSRWTATSWLLEKLKHMLQALRKGIDFFAGF